MLEMSIDKNVEHVLHKLHPQQALSLIAVHSGLKPSAIIESVEIDIWPKFVAAIKQLNICISYKTLGGIAIISRGFSAFINHEKWKKLLATGEHAKNITNINDPPKPESANGIDYQEIYAAKTVETALEVARVYTLLQKQPRLQRQETERKLGLLLGYPHCCVDNYVAKGPLAAWHSYWNTLIQKGLDQQMPVELWATYHAPCAPNCRRTLQLGAEYLDAAEKLSKRLRYRIETKLACTHLLYSVGKRIIDFVENKIEKVNQRVLKKVAKLLPEPVYVLVGEIQRPYTYYTWEEGPYKIRLTPEVIGSKIIAFSPGNGALIMDKKLKVYMYITRDILSKKYAEYLAPVYRVYRCMRK